MLHLSVLTILRYQRENGEEPYTLWFRSLRDAAVKNAIAIRLRRAEQGNLGDCKPVGQGVSELRVNVGPGYRIYFGRHGSTMVILLCGGEKRTQQRDIDRAKALWVEWKRRQS